MVLKNGRIAGFVSLWAFRFHYSTWLEKGRMVASIVFFTVSCIGLCYDVFAVGHSCGTFSFRTLWMMLLLGTTGYSIYKDLKSVFCAFSSDKTLQRYEDRTDETKDKIDGFISKIKGDSFETNAVRVDLPKIKDFLYYYPNITNVLLRRDSISVSKVEEQKTVRWRKIHENLAYALELIIVMDKIRAVWYNTRHEVQATYARQCPVARGAAAREVPPQGLRLLQGRHDEIRRREEMPHPGDHGRALVQAVRRRRGCRRPRREARAEARRREAQALRRADEGAEEGRRGQDPGPAEVRLRPLVLEGGQGVRPARIRHVDLPQDGAQVHAEDGLHLPVPGEVREGAESRPREEVAGDGLSRHQEGGGGKRRDDILGGRIVGADLRDKGEGVFPRGRLARPCRAGEQVDTVQHGFRRQQQGRNAFHGLRRGDERRRLQGLHGQAREGFALQGVPDRGQPARPPCDGSRQVAEGKQPEDQAVLSPKLFAGTQSGRISQQGRKGFACGEEAPAYGESAEGGCRVAPDGKAERAGSGQAAVP